MAKTARGGAKTVTVAVDHVTETDRRRTEIETRGGRRPDQTRQGEGGALTGACCGVLGLKRKTLRRLQGQLGKLGRERWKKGGMSSAFSGAAAVFL